MPSEDSLSADKDRVAFALEALAGPAGSFASALATALEQLRGFLDDHSPNAEDHSERISVELGPFAAGRIDSERFAQLSQHPSRNNGDGATALDTELLVRALDTLTSLHAEGDRLTHIEVAEGETLQATVERSISHLGTAFGAARVVALAKTGRYEPSEHAGFLEAFPFDLWNRIERKIAPPLVVDVKGSALRASGLDAFFDGSQKIVLIVSGDCTPAPLVRLISPSTYVLQTGDGKGLDRFAAWSGPGIAALVPESAARFAHDPEGGSTIWQRIRIDHLPETVPAGIAGWSTAQLEQELAQLAALSAPATGVAAAATAPQPGVADAPPGAAAADPADKLAAWLLQQADLTGSG